MYTFHIPQGWKFYSYKFLEQVKIANYEDIKFSNKLKPITQHVALHYGERICFICCNIYWILH
jgi:hypothetical protein